MTRSIIIAVVVHFASKHAFGSAVICHHSLHLLALCIHPLTERLNRPTTNSIKMRNDILQWWENI